MYADWMKQRYTPNTPDACIKECMQKRSRVLRK
jgi:hypothetical protein